MVELKVSLGERSYPILIGPSLLDDTTIWSQQCPARTVVIISNSVVSPLYAARLKTVFQKLGKRVIELTLPDGEETKRWEILNQVYDALLESRCDRKTTLIALGGGVIGDLTGFAAATYQRGVPFIQVPTTLLSQVDSSVGGKTGINHPLGKNMIGAFYQPRAVLMDIDTLKTLPERELSAGLAEVIKYGAIADAEFFSWLEANMAQLRECNPEVLTTAISRSCAIKADVVGQDERESGIRAILNFGHTFGHAIESGLGYGVWLHGEAIGAGMVMAAVLSAKLGLIDNALVERLRRLVAAAGLPIAAPNFPAQRWLDLMAIDKKTSDGEVRYILMDGLGRAKITPVPEAQLRATLAETATLDLAFVSLQAA